MHLNMSKTRTRDIDLKKRFSELLTTFEVEVLSVDSSTIDLIKYLKSLKLHTFYIVNNSACYIEHRKGDRSKKYYIIVDCDADDISSYKIMYMREYKILNLLNLESE